LEIQSKLRDFKSEHSDVLGLYITIAFQAIYGGIWAVSMPYVIKAVGGSDSQVGLYMGLAFGGYCFSLVLSFIYRDKIETINLKRVVQFGTGFLAVIAFLTFLTVILAEKGICKNPIAVLFVLVILQGLNTCCLWPRFVGWVSACHEGKKLNHRLGVYNLTWSTAGIIGPLVGGYLVQHSLRSPLLTAFAVSVLSFVCVFFAKRPEHQSIVENAEPLAIEPEAESLRIKFMWYCRVSFFVSMICIGIAKSQLPLLFKFELGFRESDYGTAFTIMSITTFVVFMVIARTHRWHYKMRPLVLTNMMTGAFMVLIIIGKQLWLPWTGMALGGIIYAFLYASHLYYIISGAKQRATKTVIHEMYLSAGAIVGSFAGGFLSDHFGRYSPYYFGLVVLAIGMVGLTAAQIKYRKT